MQMVTQEHPEFVIIGRRGKGRFWPASFGSVTQKLVALPCEVWSAVILRQIKKGQADMRYHFLDVRRRVLC